MVSERDIVVSGSSGRRFFVRASLHTLWASLHATMQRCRMQYEHEQAERQRQHEKARDGTKYTHSDGSKSRTGAVSAAHRVQIEGGDDKFSAAAMSATKNSRGPLESSARSSFADGDIQKDTIDAVTRHSIRERAWSDTLQAYRRLESRQHASG